MMIRAIYEVLRVAPVAALSGARGSVEWLPTPVAALSGAGERKRAARVSLSVATSATRPLALALPLPLARILLEAAVVVSTPRVRHCGAGRQRQTRVGAACTSAECCVCAAFCSLRGRTQAVAPSLASSSRLAITPCGSIAPR